MDKSVKKKIKITSRGIVTTSRGRARTPLGPYMERLGNISAMIIREKATVVEILPDGTEVPLSIQNFDKDNTKTVNVPSPKEEKVEPPKTDAVTDLNQAPTNRQLSRKERKRLEYEKKAVEAAKKGSPTKVEMNGMSLPNPVYEKNGVKVLGEKTFEELAAQTQDTTIPEDAIEG